MKNVLLWCSVALSCVVAAGCASTSGGSPGSSPAPYPAPADPYPSDHAYWQGIRDQERADWERERYKEEAVDNVIERQRMHGEYVAHEHAWENAQRQHWERDHAAELRAAAPARQHTHQQEMSYHRELAQKNQATSTDESSTAAQSAQSQRDLREHEIRPAL